MRVLFVEDNQQVAETVSLALKSRGHRCRCLLLGAPAVPLAKDEDFDIVVLDIDLPDVNGCEVLDRLRAEGVKTPVLLQSGLPEGDLPGGGMALGGDDFLYKPFSIDQLLERMESAIQKGRTKNEANAEPEPQPADEDESALTNGQVAKFAVPPAVGPKSAAQPCSPVQGQPEEPVQGEPEAEEAKSGRNRRRHERHDTFGAAVITDGGRHIACAIRNLSESGAALRLADENVECPDVFTLRQLDGPERRCTLRWRHEDRMGVEFIDDTGSAGGAD